MRILVDLQGCQSGSRFGGIGRYSMALAKAMVRQRSFHEISLLLNSRLPNESLIRAEFADLLPQQNILTFAVPAYVAAENDLPGHTRMAELIREKRIAEIDPDVLHIASLFEGAGEDVVTSVGMLFPAERTAVTLYDLIPYLEQDIYLTNRMLLDHYLRKLDGLKRAGMIVSISEFSRIEALQHTSIPEHRIANISSAVDRQFAPFEIDAKSKQALLLKSGIQKKFLMFTGSFDTRKNHRRLVEAFAKIPSVLRQQYQLVIIGKGEDRQVARLRALGQSQGLHDNELVFVGHVSDSHLVSLYNLCALFVFPSLREGFGLPVLEAMSCGVPTIGSNRTSIPEVIDRADALFDPEDVNDITAKMVAVLSDAAFRTELKRHGLERAKNFSWELTAQRALAFFESKFEQVRAPSSAMFQLQSDPYERVECTASYVNFIAAFSPFKLEIADAEFLDSAARVIAANEFLTHIESENYCADLRIGWVTNLSSECMTLGYSAKFFEAFPKQPTVFVARAEQIFINADASVPRCWNAGVGQGNSELQQALAAAQIDTVVVQYQQDMFALSALAELVAQQQKLNRYVFVVFNSIGSEPTFPSKADMLEVRRVLKTCDGIFVHSLADVKILDAFNIRKNVSLLPIAEIQPALREFIDTNHDALRADYFLRKMVIAIACREV